MPPRFFESGVGAEEIDQALLQWGMPMGPLRLIDEIGVDITVDIADTLEKAFGARDRAPEILRKMHEAKMLGRKSGGGFYKYEGKAANAERGVAGMEQSTGGQSRPENASTRAESTRLTRIWPTVSFS